MHINTGKSVFETITEMEQEEIWLAAAHDVVVVLRPNPFFSMHTTMIHSVAANTTRHESYTWMVPGVELLERAAPFGCVLAAGGSTYS